MEPEVFTAPWAEAWCAELNASEPYRKAAARWEGALVLVMTENPAMGVGKTRRLFLDLHHGSCRGARAATTDDAGSAPFVLEAPPAVWKRVLEGGLDPLLGLMTGKVRLARGSLAKLTPQVQAAKELVRSAGRLPTSFPPGWLS